MTGRDDEIAGVTMGRRNKGGGGLVLNFLKKWWKIVIFNCFCLLFWGLVRGEFLRIFLLRSWTGLRFFVFGSIGERWKGISGDI